MDEITLKGGAVVRYEMVPFTLAFDVMDRMAEFKTPDEPIITIRTKVGSETKPAPKDSKEWKDYEAQQMQVLEMRTKYAQFLPWQEGIVEWKLAGSETWESQPPANYRLPKMLEAVGSFAPLVDNRRIAYIRYVVCKDMADVFTLNQAILSGLPITTEEVDAAVEGFPGETPRVENAKPARKRNRV